MTKTTHALLLTALAATSPSGAVASTSPSDLVASARSAILTERCDGTVIRRLREAADEHDLKATEDLALAYDRGCGVRQDMYAAASEFSTAIAHGDRSELALAYVSYVRGSRPRNARATALARAAERHGDCFAPHLLAWIAANEIPANTSEAHGQNELGAVCGDVDAKADLLAEVEGKPAVLAAIRELLAMGTAEAAYDAAHLSYHQLNDYGASTRYATSAIDDGLGVADVFRAYTALERRDERALRANGLSWLHAGLKTFPDYLPLEYLGYMYVYGVGVAENSVLGASYYRRAETEGDVTAMAALGTIELMDPRSPVYDAADGLRLLNEAAGRGNRYAETNLAVYRWNATHPIEEAESYAGAPADLYDPNNPDSPMSAGSGSEQMPAPGSVADPNAQENR